MKNTTLIHRILGLIQTLARWRQSRIDVAKLSVMDDHMLKDIGLSRSQIEYLVSTTDQSRQ